MKINRPHPVNSLRISPGIQEIKDEDITFSFKYLDSTNEKFKFDGRGADYFLKLIDRLKSISNMKAMELKSNRSRTLKCHPIRWEDTSENSFGLPEEQEAQLKEAPMQFNLSVNEYGRVHGFFIGNAFFVRWLDPEHALYPRKD